MTKPFLSLIFLFFSIGAQADTSGLSESKDNIRFDVHAQSNGFRVVARGKPGQNLQALTSTVDERAKVLCADATPTAPPKEAEYDYLEGGANILMPVGGIFIPLTTYSRVSKAPSLTVEYACPQAIATVLSPELQVAIDNQLGETIAYIDQGFASFNRDRLDVQIGGTTLTQVIREAVVEALAARGYTAQVSEAAHPTQGRVTVSKASVPNERFDGVAMLTKIGLLGISNLSAAFCSIQVTVNAPSEVKPLTSVGVSTRQMLPAIYSSWEKDMANGPSLSTHEKTSALLAATLAANVRAAIHALPVRTIQALLTPKAL